MEFHEQAHQDFSIGSILHAGAASYAVGMGIIVTYNPYTHVYGVTPNPSQHGVVLPAVALGALGNVPDGVQANMAYNLQDEVLYLYQTNLLTASGSDLAIIIGAAPMHKVVTSNVDELVATAGWDFRNLDATHYDLWRRMELLKGMTEPIRMIGHGGNDMLPGDYEFVGRLTSLIIGDYIAGLKAPAAEVLVSGMDRRLILQSMLRTDLTVNSAEDIAIVGTSTVTTKQSTGNVSDAWYDGISETENELDIKPNNEFRPRYREIEQSGDLLYGTHKVVLGPDFDTPVYSEYTGLDGTKSIYSATRISIGKRPQLISKRYAGERLSKALEVKPTPEDLGNPLRDVSPGASWILSDDAFLMGFNDGPDAFVPTNASGYEDTPTKELEDPILGKVAISKGYSHIDFLDDGSVRIKDAWGSYILLTHGNIEFHAANNIFGIASRDMLFFAGANRVDYAQENIEVQAYNGDIKQLAGNDWHVQSESGNTTLESGSTVQMLGNDIKLDGLNIVVTCRDTYRDTLVGGGSFQVLAPEGQIGLSGATARIVGETAACLITKQTGIALTGNIGIAGDLMLQGGILCTDNTISVTAVQPDGTPSNYVISPGSLRSIINRNGGVQANGNIFSTNAIVATGFVIGQQMYTLDTPVNNGKLVKVTNAASIRSACSRWPVSRTPSLTLATPSSDVMSPISIKDACFKFINESRSCKYTLCEQLPKNGATLDNTGYVARVGDTTYIYPGREFWKGSGLSVNVNNTRDIRGFSSLAVAEPNTIERK